MKILLAVDGSKSSMDAVASLVERVHWYRDKPVVELVTVQPPIPRLPGMSLAVGKGEIERYIREEGEANLRLAKKSLGAAGIVHTPHILVGPVAETIVAHARDRRCDMILIGTRGMTAAANMLLGSIAGKVLSLSSVPVMLVK
jgi:nucleotide-binding universal stress UspA family protein